MTKDVSILGREAYLDFYVGGAPHVPKILVIGQPNGSSKMRETKVGWEESKNQCFWVPKWLGRNRQFRIQVDGPNPDSSSFLGIG
jgi:hypothetical protein